MPGHQTELVAGKATVTGQQLRTGNQPRAGAATAIGQCGVKARNSTEQAIEIKMGVGAEGNHFHAADGVQAFVGAEGFHQQGGSGQVLQLQGVKALVVGELGKRGQKAISEFAPGRGQSLPCRQCGIIQRIGKSCACGSHALPSIPNARAFERWILHSTKAFVDGQ